MRLFFIGITALFLSAGVVVLVNVLNVYFAKSNTEYAMDFSQEAFESLYVGQGRDMVDSVLGEPLEVIHTSPFLSYYPRPTVVEHSRSVTSFHFSAPSRERELMRFTFDSSGLVRSGPRAGQTRQEIVDEFGQPVQESAGTMRYLYTTAKDWRRDYHIVEIRFDHEGIITGLFSTISD